jgi:hypothetical protein
MIDWGARAQEVAQEHVAACIEAEEARSDGLDVPSPASEEFCDCLRCIIRETLYAAWPVMVESVRDGDYEAEVARVANNVTPLRGRHAD